MLVQAVPLGNVVITPNALGQLTPADIQLGLQRHQAGDWGDLGEEDWKENDNALRTGLRLLSSYRSSDGVTFWEAGFHANADGCYESGAGIKFGPVVVGSLVAAYSVQIAIGLLATIYVIDMIATVFLIPELKGTELK